ncbi:MAG: thioredoxin family protein, partial [Proteobacteria bacterium]|nr:thioredoxin family protein [Pseudomonadota bacterium]
PDFPPFIFWEYNYEQALDIAEKKSGVVLAYVYSKDCDWCRKMEEDTLSHPEVIEFSQGHVFLKLNADTNVSKMFIEQYRIRNLPTVMVLNSFGREMYRESNYLDPSQFLMKMKPFSQLTHQCLKPNVQSTQSLQFYFNYAKKAFEHLEFLEATKALDYILSRDPDNKQGLNDEVLLLFGTSLVYLYQLEAAEVLLARLCIEFPKSRAVPDSMYILGEIYIQTNRTKLGRELLERLMKEYPEHVMARKAKMALRRINREGGG